MYSMEDRAAFHIFLVSEAMRRDIDYASVNLNRGNHRPGGAIHPNE